MKQKARGRLVRLAGEAGGECVMTPAQIQALTAPDVKVELFVSSRLGPYVSCETKQEHDEERSVVERAISALGDRGQ